MDAAIARNGFKRKNQTAVNRKQKKQKIKEEQQRKEREEHDVASQVLIAISYISMICESQFFYGGSNSLIGLQVLHGPA